VSTRQPRGSHLMALPRVHTNLSSRHFATSDVESDPSQPPNPRMHDRRWGSRSNGPPTTQIQWLSFFLAPRIFATWSTQCLGSHPTNFRVREISRSLPPVLLRWTAPGLLATSLPLMSLRFATLDTKLSALLLTNSRHVMCHLSACRPLWPHTVLVVVGISYITIYPPWIISTICSSK
jgi:hypothetical protein